MTTLVQTYDTTSDDHTNSDDPPHSTAAKSTWQTIAGREATLMPSLASVQVGVRTSLAAPATINTAEADTRFREALEEAARVGLQQAVLDRRSGILLRELLARVGRGSNPQKRQPFRAPIGHGRDEQPLESPAVSDTSNGSVSLSPQARCILDLIEQGNSNKEIARNLGIAPETVKSHLRRIFVKLDVDRRAMAVLRARRLGFRRVS
jgi:LuxR family transcriptional regulator, maltose regulon positive regulatory protein